MKLTRFTLGAALILLAASPVLGQTLPARPAIQSSETILRVIGEGKVLLDPEILDLRIGVTTSAKTALEALALNNERSETLVKRIRALGIPAKDIRTTDLAVEPVYSESLEGDEIAGWTAVNSLSVRSRDVEGAGEMIALLFDAGGNTLETPEFGLTDAARVAGERDAQVLALRDAREEAEAAALALDMKVARVLLVSDSRVNFRGGSGYITVTASRRSRPVVPIEPGQIEVEARYSVEFALVPQ